VSWPLVCWRFQLIRQAAEQNRACSRRGLNAPPHWAQLRSSAITQGYVPARVR